jgi:hypothetical protein
MKTLNKERRVVRCEFTQCEMHHILSLIRENERNGEYTAPADQYWNRSNRIINKFHDAFYGGAE